MVILRLKTKTDQDAEAYGTPDEATFRRSAGIQTNIIF